MDNYILLFKKAIHFANFKLSVKMIKVDLKNKR